MGPQHSSQKGTPLRNADGEVISVYSRKELKIRYMCLGKGSADHLARLLSSPDDEVPLGDCCVPIAKKNKDHDEPRKPLDVRDLRFEDGKTCLHLSAQSGNMDMCRFLVEYKGIDMNVQTIPGLTPMHLACLHDQMDVVLYFISILAKLDVPDVSGKFPLDYCQSEEIHAVVSRNTRRGSEDKNEITPEFDYGHFKWSKAEDNFTSQNPLRAKKTPTKDSSSEIVDRDVGAPMTPSETESKDECGMDFFSSPLDRRSPRELSDVHIKVEGGDDEIQQQVDDVKSHPVPSDSSSLASSQPEKHLSGGSKSTDTYMANIALKSSNSSTAAASGSASQSTKTNSSFYQMFRKGAILTKLADGRQSGRAVTAGSGTGDRKHRDV